MKTDQEFLGYQEYEREKAEDAERWEEYLRTGEYVSQEVMARRLREIAEHGSESKLRRP